MFEMAGDSDCWRRCVGMVCSTVLISLAAFAPQSASRAFGQDDIGTVRLDALILRLEQTENAILELTEENDQMRTQLQDAYELIDEKLAASPVAAAAPPVPEQKESKWYDKINLRGYTQLRYNHVTHLEPGSTRPQHAGDSSISDDQEFLLRRVRMIFFGDVGEHLYIYIQPDFASTPNGSVDGIHFSQLRDVYGDVYIDTDKVHRLRVGLSKIPYGWENMQSSSNRLYLDRNDAFNSATRNERDLGVFYYWTPGWVQDTFDVISDERLKGSGNYGMFGFGAYNGQGGSLREFNDELHLISRLTLPLTMANGQIVEFAMQGYTGRYVVLGSAIRPLGVGPATVPIGTRNNPEGEGMLDQRLGWTFVYYPQPLGIQAEYTIGRGPRS
jgi:hypothetical protein